MVDGGMTLEEVAERLRVSVRTVRRLIARGVLETSRGRRREHRVSEEQLDLALDRLLYIPLAPSSTEQA